MLKIIKKAIGGSNNTNNVASHNTSNDSSPVQNNGGYTNNALDNNSFLESQYTTQTHGGQYNSNGANYNMTYNGTSFNPNTIRKSKNVHNETGAYNLGDGLQNHPQGKPSSVTHRGNGFNSPVSCLPQSNMNFSTTPQSSPNAHQMHLNQNIPLSKHQYYSQNQNVLSINKKPTSNNSPFDIEFYEQKLKLSQQKNQDLENQCKINNDQNKELKGTIQSLNDMNHKFYDEIQHLKERNLEQRKQIDSFNKLFQDCKQDSERKLTQIRQELEQSLKREIDLKKMVQQIQETKNQEINSLKEKIDRAKMIESQQNSELDKKKLEIKCKGDRVDLLEKNLKELEKEFNLYKENTIAEKKAYDLSIENLKSQIDILNRQIQEEKTNYDEKSNLEKMEQKKHLDELELKLEEIIKEKAEITCKYGQILEQNKELNEIIKLNDESKEKSLKDSLNQLEIYKNKCANLERELFDCKEQHSKEKEEWKKFQADLQTAVRVANDFMNEAEEKYNRIREEYLNSREMFGLPVDEKIKKDVLRNNENGCKTNGEKKRSDDTTSDTKVFNNRNLIEQVDLVENFQTNTDTDDAKLLSFNQNGQYSFQTQKRPSVTSATNESSPVLPTSNYDCLSTLVKQYGVSKRNALMKWCQERLCNYDIEIKNFSSSWSDGLAFCALLHSFIPEKIDFEMLKKEKNARVRLSTAFNLADSIGIEHKLDINEIVNQDRPDWNEIMNYVALIYIFFNKKNQSTDDLTNKHNKNFSKIFESPKEKSFSINLSNSSSNLATNK